MPRIAILGTCHEVQGAQGWKNRRLDDAQYREVLEELMKGRDFLFEEASGAGPTTAQNRCNDLLGLGHYRDIDPAIDDRSVFGIGETGEKHFIPPGDPTGIRYASEVVTSQGVRENLWVGRIREEQFENGLFVCGFLHTLSISFKLLAAGFTVEAFHYMPWAQFCIRQHVE